MLLFKYVKRLQKQELHNNSSHMHIKQLKAPDEAQEKVCLLLPYQEIIIG